MTTTTASARLPRGDHGGPVEVQWEAGPLTILLGPEGVRRDGLLRAVFVAAEFPYQVEHVDPRWRRLAPEAVLASTVAGLVGPLGLSPRWRDPACGRWGEACFRLWGAGCDAREPPGNDQRPRAAWCLPEGRMSDVGALDAARGVLCVPRAEGWSPGVLEFVWRVARRPGWHVIASGRSIPKALRDLHPTEVIVGSCGRVAVR